MSKKKELWLAFAGDDMTCSVAVNEGSNGLYVEVTLAGIMNPKRVYVQDLIMDVVENSSYDEVFLNACNLSFFSGHTVNDCAIEQLLRLVCYFCQANKKLHILLDDGYLRDVLKADLLGKKYHGVNVADSHSIAVAKARLERNVPAT